MKRVRILGRAVPWATSLSTLLLASLPYPADLPAGTIQRARSMQQPEVRPRPPGNTLSGRLGKPDEVAQAHAPKPAILPPATTAGSSVVGSVPGDHGSPAVARHGDGELTVAAHVIASGGDADIYAWRLGTALGGRAWPEKGVEVCKAPGDQLRPVVVSDGSGGAIVAWTDLRNEGDFDVYAHHVLKSGVLDPTWPPGGLAVCTESGVQTGLGIVGDGHGGALISWEDLRGAEYEVYLHRVLASGQLDPRWPATGYAVSSLPGTSTSPGMISDGAGGAILSWTQDSEPSGSDIFIQRILESGVADPSWPETGFPVCDEVGDQFEPVMVTDGARGAIVTWTDRRHRGTADIYAHRILASGEPDPRWPRQGTPVCVAEGAQTYPAATADGTGGAYVAWQDERPSTTQAIRVQHILEAGVVDPGWKAQGTPVPTATHRQWLPRVVSDGANGCLVAWLESGEGVDSRLQVRHFLASGTPDFAWPALDASSHSAAEPALVDAGAAAGIAVWKDAHSSNLWTMRIGPGETLTPAQIRYSTAFLAPAPNPAASSVAFRFTLATPQHARLDVFDVAGRRVANLVDHPLEAGPHEVVWRAGAETSTSRHRPAVYFARFAAGSLRVVERFVVIH